MIGASEDGSYIYFVASGALAPGSERGACYSEEATCNLYVRHYSGGEWEPAQLIAVLSGEDAPDWDAIKGRSGSELSFMTSRVSPNGQWLAFMSERRLTGYDNEDRGSEEPGERLDEEVYLYNAQNGSLVCASCNPTGQRPAGVLDEASKLPRTGPNGEKTEGVGLVIDRGEIWGKHWLAGSVPGWTRTSGTSSIYQSRYLSNSGRLFFNSPDALVPAVEEELKAGKTSKEKVYQYEPQGLGSCASAGGCVGLISSAGAQHETAFLDASANGNDIFFLSAEPLVQLDKDESFDVYDAHVCEAVRALPAAARRGRSRRARKRGRAGPAPTRNRATRRRRAAPARARATERCWANRSDTNETETETDTEADPRAAARQRAEGLQSGKEQEQAHRVRKARPGQVCAADPRVQPLQRAEGVQEGQVQGQACRV